MDEKVLKRLAERLDALPNGFPATEDGAELRLLAYLFSPQEADIAVKLRATPETVAEIAARIGESTAKLTDLLIGMARKGLITTKKVDGEKAYCLMPFMIGFYEEQVESIDAELARLVEDYMQQAFNGVLGVEPQLHRVVSVNETIQTGMEVHPYESIVDIVASAKAWSVFDCICRKQKTLIGEACEHPVDICMAFSEIPGAFDGSSFYKALTQEEAVATLKRATDAGLVHTVSNSQEDIGYLCNCCTCSCGVLRGIAEMGMANIVARSAFVNTVDAAVCSGCETCLDYCQFNTLTMEDGITVVNEMTCMGCGVCVPFCETEAMTLVRRPDEEVLQIPVTKEDWGIERAEARGIDISIIR
jgi:Pyruvate/2-oxoacid:ferredoxin oxidoreductase delta subunit